MAELTAAAVMIGNEILSGKVTDTNSPFLATELRGLGVALNPVAVIPDELDVIAHEVRSCHETNDVVFTSGGVGPTHDDITMEGIARRLGPTVILHAPTETMLRAFYGQE